MDDENSEKRMDVVGVVYENPIPRPRMSGVGNGIAGLIL